MRIFGLLLISLFSSLGFSQIGGISAYKFLGLPDNARVLALGGENISLYDRDVNLIRYNPAALNEDMATSVGFNYLPFIADVKKVSMNAALELPYVKQVGFSVEYLGYGTLTETDKVGNELGTFTAGEYSIALSKSHVIGPYRMGAALRLAGAQYAGYKSTAMLLDVGGLFVHPKRDFTIALAVRNLGVVLSEFSETSESNLPLDVQFGLSYKLEHMPLKFNLGTHHLNNPKIQYLDPSRTVTFDDQGEEIPGSTSVSEQIARHFVFGGEFVFGKGFHLRAGYNHMRRKELRQVNVRGPAGFSLGAMVRTKKFQFDFARAFYHAVGGSTVISLSCKLSEFWTQGIERTPIETETE